MVLPLAKVPVPPVHVILAALVALAPVMLTAPAFEQVVWLAPATAVGAAVIVNTFVEATVVHGAVPVAVNVSVTLPVVISAPLGVYVGVSVAAPVNVPEPLPVQLTPVEFAELAPVILTAPEPEHVV